MADGARQYNIVRVELTVQNGGPEMGIDAVYSEQLNMA